MTELSHDSAVFLEPDSARLVRRISAVVGQDLSQARVSELAAGDLSILTELPTTSQQSVLALIKPGSSAAGELESMIGSALDFVPIAYLELGTWAARAVARITNDKREAKGTGTLISSQLLLTNHHVTPDAAQARHQLAQFDYQLDVDGSVRATTDFALDPDAFFWTSPEQELDATIVSIGQRVSGPNELNVFGFEPLSAAGDKHAEGDFVTIVQHPEGDFKQIALRENRVRGRGRRGTTLYYGADTLPGSSGSPVFNDQFEFVALHHAGGPKNDDTFEDGTPVTDANEGIRISALVKALRDVLDGLPAGPRALLTASLDTPNTGPHLMPDDLAPKTEGRATSPTPTETAASTEPTRGDDGWIKISVPLDIAVRANANAGAGEPVTTFGGPTETGALERNQEPDQRYGRRRGYNAEFLAIPVPLPNLSASRLQDAAVPDQGTRSDAGVVVAYLHFSLVMHAARRMPFFTAVNIDGGRSRTINRATGEIEASEIWYLDPRIGESQQLDQSVFEHQQPRIFDRGHLVRRLDPAWGAAATARRAADDTFHFTNCSLQVAAFNERKNLWAGIEDYALINAKTERARISVFSGPVYADDDPDFRGVGVPQAFWKIVVRIADGAMRATGFLADQRELLDRALGAPEQLEGWDDLGSVATFQTRVSDLEAKTGLDFDVLPDHDTFVLEAAEPARLEALEQASW